MIRVVGINGHTNARLLKRKLIQADREARKAKHEALMREKEALVEIMVEKEANFMAQGMSRA